MSRNYELLRASEQAPRLFGLMPEQPATDDISDSQRTRTGTVDRPVSSDGGNGSASWPQDPGNDFAEPTGGAVPAATEGESTSGLFRRGKLALSRLLASPTALMRSRWHGNGRMDLVSMAREEQVKLVQRVFLSPTPAPRVVVFCGTELGNGCSRICAESASMLATQTSGTVCLVDADLRAPTLHRMLGLKNGKGFVEAMLQAGPMRDYSHRLGARNLWVMTGGTLTSDPHTLLTSETLRPRMEQLSEAFDFVLIDVAPLNCFADAIKIAAVANGTVLVMGANSTRREAARKAKEALETVDCKILAAVLNRRTFPIPDVLYRRL